MSDQDLIERARAGDRSAMAELYNAHARRVYAVIRRLAGDDHLAEDLSQDAWVRAFEKLHLFRGDAAFGTWLHRLAVNTALNRLRRSGRRPDVEKAAAGARVEEGHADTVLNQRVLDAALDRLPEGYRRALVLHDIEGYTHEEIGEMLGVASGTSKSQLHKARARMRELLSVGESAASRVESAASRVESAASPHLPTGGVVGGGTMETEAHV